MTERITSGLRTWTSDHFGVGDWRYESIMELADRIDASLAERYVELPKDADGEYIHIGDKVTCGASVWEVTGFRFTGGFWGICCTIFNDQGGSGTNVYPPSDLHHYHSPTVEDVLREFAQRWDDPMRYDREELVEQYAAKIKLADDEKEQ